MYNSVAEIWAYDAREGAKTLRTFHECSVTAVASSSAAAAAAAAAPVAEQPRVMRLSYYGYAACSVCVSVITAAVDL
jgi:hypothetical protein